MSKQDNGKLVVPFSKITLAELTALKEGTYQLDYVNHVVVIDLVGAFPDIDGIEFLPLTKGN